MLVSLKWLKDYIDISGLSVSEIAEKLTMAGLEVEGVHSSAPVEKLVVAKVEELTKHPDADKLNVCKVFDGKDTLQVVCGAPNVAAGQTVVLAQLGAVLPGDFKIKEAKIRGVASSGMLCSERELGLSDKHEGIIVLSEEIAPGTDANPLLGLGDSLLEIGVTPNRGDCLSIYGVARDVAAIFDRPVIYKHFAVDDEIEDESTALPSLTVQNYDACPYYSARIIKGVKLGASPLWMQRRIISAGMRPVNNVVDVTNYVMLEYGQPLHAFDLSVIDRGIIVRNAKAGEVLVTLDGKERKLDESMTLIADHSKVLGLAGVMGGEYSGVNDSTVDLLLECAFFSPISVALTSKKLGINSDSAFRYARGVDGGRTRTMLDYAADMMTKICGGAVLSYTLSDGTAPASYKSIVASVGRINALVGISLTAAEMSALLNRLGMMATAEGADKLFVSVPSHRTDIIHEASLAEEVARLYGIDKIPTVLPSFQNDMAPLAPALQYRRRLRHGLSRLGFTETIGYSFVSKDLISMFDSAETVPLLNPLSEEMATLRTRLAPSVVKALSTNYNQGDRSVKLFEIATVFHKSNEVQPHESTRLSIGVMGDFASLSWTAKQQVDNFFHLKGVLENIFTDLKVRAEYIETDMAWLTPGKRAMIAINGETIGYMGALHPALMEKLDLKAPVYLAELDFDAMAKLYESRNTAYKPFSRFPSVYKDISVLVKTAVPVRSMTELIWAESQLVQDVTLYDVYQGENIAPDERSLTFRLLFSSADATLTDAEINPLLMKIAATLAEKCDARLR